VKLELKIDLFLFFFFKTQQFMIYRIVALLLPLTVYSVEITNGINSVISKLMTFVENVETGRIFFIMSSIFELRRRHQFF
jgi:hypothetical protein